jgi:hypothetical protein
MNCAIGDGRKTVRYVVLALQVQHDELETDIELGVAVRSRCRSGRGTACWMIAAITEDRLRWKVCRDVE